MSLDPVYAGSDSNRNRLRETFLGWNPNGIIVESNPVWVPIADLNGLGSVGHGSVSIPCKKKRGLKSISPFERSTLEVEVTVNV